MEISITAIRGRKVNVIFNGSTYYFHNSFFGFLAIAERDYNEEKNGKAAFTIIVGNHHTTGGSLCNSAIETAVKRFINKAECNFVDKKVKYTTVEKDLANVFVKIEYTF